MISATDAAQEDQVNAVVEEGDESPREEVVTGEDEIRSSVAARPPRRRGRESRRKRSRSSPLFSLLMADDFGDFIKNCKDVGRRAGRDFILPNVNMMRKVFKFGEVRGIIPAANGIIVFV